MVAPKRRYAIRPLAWFCALSAANAFAGDLQVKPGIDLDSYLYQLKQDQSEQWDEGAAFAATPNLSLLFDSKAWQSTFDWRQKNIRYDDTQRDNKKLDYFDFNSRLSAWDNRAVWSVNAGEGYRQRNTQRGVFADEITGFNLLSKTRYMGTALALSTAQYLETQAQVNLAARKISSERPELDDEVESFDNAFYSTDFNFGTARRKQGFFWQLSGRVSENVRENAVDLNSENVDAVVGIPLLKQWAWVSKTRYEKNELYANSDNEFGSVGTGVEYRFGKVSYINLTYNYYRQQQFRIEEDDYWAVDMLLAPTRRSSIKLNIDRRYYGRSVEVQGRYRIQHVSANLNYSERLQLMNGLDAEINNLGVLVCPAAFADVAECFLPPTSNYELAPGEYLQNVSVNEVEFNQSVVLRKTGSFNLGYDKNRLLLGLTLSRYEDEYVETQRFNQTDSLLVSGRWRLSPTTSFTSEYSWYKLQYSEEARTDYSLRLKAGLSMELNARSTVSFNAQRIKRTSNLPQYDRQENRVWLSYSYQI